MNVSEIHEDKNGGSYHGANLVFDVDMGDRYVTVIVMDDDWSVGDPCPEDTRALANKIRGSLANESPPMQVGEGNLNPAPPDRPDGP